ncbi:hypothetical protein [Vibrio campbellii]|uniref:hypothetical protein n=1 Tax=Vibrio campbellii TaxID=680 RepID=UPI00142E91B5|nr:hypothetical protein [Vibrio campbellii]NIY89257.1 hypothetical protein [Vibrio campbellii]NVK69981.1 hypothetical protein [Vibrio campbellii]
MALTVLNNPIDSFWHDQNQKLLANPFFISDRGDYYCDEWYFYERGGVTKIDFSVFDSLIFNFDTLATLQKNGAECSLTSKEYAKLFCMAVLTTKSSRAVLPAYQMAMHLFAFFNERHEIALSASLLDAFWTSFMARTVNQNGLFNRVSAPSHQGYIKPVPFSKLRNQLMALGVTGVIEQRLTQKQVEKSLDRVCQSQYSMTLVEYKKGGSFNFLGLELGQYYVDYLNHVYQNNFLYTAVCRKAVRAVIAKVGFNYITESRSRNRLFNVIIAGLLGQALDTAQSKTKGINHQDLKRMTENALVSEYNKHFDSISSLKDDNIESLVTELGLGARFDAVEVIRVLMLQKFMGLRGHKSAADVWSGYLSSLDKSFLDSQSLSAISVDDVYAKMQSRVSQQRLIGKKCLTSIQQWATGLMATSAYRTYESFKAILDTQLHAMTALVVAWTGYRKSEYGFPLNAIRTEPNLDILDNAYVPFRFKLKWFVPKTNGGTKIDREMTSQCYQVAAQLNELFGHEHDEPCLYDLTCAKTNKETAHQSVAFIEGRVKANWVGFINYKPFNEVIRLSDLLQKNSELTSLEQEEVEALSLKYPVGSARYRHLLSSAKEVKTGWFRLSHTSFAGYNAQKKLKQSLVAYSQGDPVENDEHQTIIDNYLSSETKALLQSGTLDLGDRKTMFDITSEILEGVRYPSPHAFRHIWAEAVLTRYQGDVGAVIRHQFCHLDDSFFMAYLRDKDARGLMASAKQRYLNSVVELLIIESNQFDENHSGGFSRFVQKATQLTQVKTESQIRALRETIVGRIIDIQPSRFAVCIPRDGGESRARCAKMGSLNPQDAKPEFCLNCTNALITEGNIRGIWQTIQPMVIEAMQPMGIGFLLEAHLPALTSSWKRIKELRNSKNGENVDKILSAIEEAVDSIRRKMAVEAKQYGYE